MMPDSVQEPRKLRVKNGTESGSWDETQLAPVFFSAVFAMLTMLFTVNNDIVHYLWFALIVGTVSYLTLQSNANPNMRKWQVMYAYLFTQRGTYNFMKNEKIILEDGDIKNEEV